LIVEAVIISNNAHFVHFLGDTIPVSCSV